MLNSLKDGYPHHIYIGIYVTKGSGKKTKKKIVTLTLFKRNYMNECSLYSYIYFFYFLFLFLSVNSLPSALKKHTKGEQKEPLSTLPEQLKIVTIQ